MQPLQNQTGWRCGGSVPLGLLDVRPHVGSQKLEALGTAQVLSPRGLLCSVKSQGHRRRNSVQRSASQRMTRQCPPTLPSPFLYLQKLQSSNAPVHFSSTHPSVSPQQDGAEREIEKQRLVSQPASSHTMNLT